MRKIVKDGNKYHLYGISDWLEKNGAIFPMLAIVALFAIIILFCVKGGI